MGEGCLQLCIYIYFWKVSQNFWKNSGCPWEVRLGVRKFSGDFYLILFIFCTVWKFTMNKNIKVIITEIWGPKHRDSNSEDLKFVSKSVFIISPGVIQMLVTVENHFPVCWPEWLVGRAPSLYRYNKYLGTNLKLNIT